MIYQDRKIPLIHFPLRDIEWVILFIRPLLIQQREGVAQFKIMVELEEKKKNEEENRERRRRNNGAV